MDAFTMQCAVPHVPLDVSVRDASMKAAVALAGVGPAGEALHAQQTYLQLARASSTGQRLDLAKAELHRDAWLALETALEKLYAEAAAELAGQELLASERAAAGGSPGGDSSDGKGSSAKRDKKSAAKQRKREEAAADAASSAASEPSKGALQPPSEHVMASPAPGISGTSRRALIVATSCGSMRKTGDKTGCWCEEVAAPYTAFTGAGYHVDITTPGGAAVPWDPASLEEDKMTAACRQFMADATAQQKCQAPISLSKVASGGEYNIVYLAGGHGAMFDFPNNKTLATCLGAAAAANRVVAAVCHGVCGLLHVTEPRSGQLLLAGKRACSFTGEEEIAVGMQKVVPFNLERAVEKCGSTFVKAPPWTCNVVRDGQLVTGQNPQSSAALAQECLKAAEELAGQPETPRPK